MPKVELELHVNVQIDKHNLETGEVTTEHHHNLAVDDGLNMLRDVLANTGATGLNYFAVGTGTTKEAASDHTLVAEVFRNTFTKTDTSVSKQLQIKYYLASTEANGNTIGEAAIFGNGATAAANSGVMMARVTFPAEAKTSAQAWTFTWTISVAAG